jgi:alpha-L-fucosidase
MKSIKWTRRDFSKVALGSLLPFGAAGLGGISMAALPPRATAAGSDADQVRRMKWWHQAKFGMFIHWGLYSLVGREAWALELEGIPVAEYEQLAKRFTPKPNAAQDWAKLARQAGQKYMVLTTKHHEGFCLFDTRYTDYCAPKQACGRDLVKEYVEAARAEGLRVGFYYSLMDWHHPDGALCTTDEAARKRFVEYIHGQIRELMTNYGKIDILWYDVSWPLDAKGWESEKMNEMVFKLQPDIIVNNRNALEGDFSTPEQEILPAEGQRAWETCMTLNDSFGYHKADDNWKSPKTIVRQLASCAGGGGNYLLNIGPLPDGSVPTESSQILAAVGKWLEHNGESIYGTERVQFDWSAFLDLTRKGNTLYIHVYFWPGEAVSIGGLVSKVKSARLLASGKAVDFEQDRFRLSFLGLPANPPDELVTVIAAECDAPPGQNAEEIVRKGRPRGMI